MKTPKNEYTVVGASGFIGSNLVEYLKSKGCVVNEINRDLSSWPKDKNLGVVIYCAGYGNCSKPDLVFEANCNYYSEVFSYKYDKVFYISSTRLYLNNKDGSESSDLTIGIDDSRKVFNISKLHSENLVEDNRVISLRVSNVYGNAYNSPLFLPSIIRNAVNSGKISLYTSGDYSKDYINVLDVCDAIYKLSNVKSLKFPIYNIASSKKISAYEIINKMETFLEFDIEWNDLGLKEYYPDIDISRISKEIEFYPSDVLEDIIDMSKLFQNNADCNK